MEDEQNTFVIRPNFENKFRPLAVQQVLRDILQQQYADRQYDAEQALSWSKETCSVVKDKLKELDLPRYKFVVQTYVGQQNGAGVKVASRCLWDADTDNYAQESFINESLFCVCVVHGVYYY